MTRLHPHLNFAGNAEQAFESYRSVFGGEFSSLVRFKDFPIEGVTIPEEDGDKIMHMGLPIGEDEVLMASDTLRSLGQELVQGNNFYISVQPGSREEADRDLHRPVRGRGGGDADRRPGLGGLLRKLQGQVRGHVDGELQPAAGSVATRSSWPSSSTELHPS